MSEPFIAEVRIFTYNFAPRGWAYCDGQLLPVAQNTALFSLIGTTYGGDGRTTMALPNLQGRVPIHPGRGPGLTARKLGEKIGTAAVSLNESQIPSHSHTLNVLRGKIPDSASPAGLYPAGVAGEQAYKTNPSSLTAMSPSAASTTGGSQGHQNMQPFLGLSFCIALVGLYPSRS